MTEQTPEEFADAAFASALENPALAEAAARLAADDGPVEIPTLTDPSDGPVHLPGGFTRMTVSENGTERETITTAWVRELDGEDEEHIAKAKLRDDPAAFLWAILEAGVEKLGDATPTRDDLRNMLMGDRDFLLLEIARATYGDDLDYDGFLCYNCGKEISFTLHLSEDIPIKRLDSVEDSEFEVKLSKDRVARVHLPDVSTAEKVGKAETPAQANTLIIAGSLEEIRGGGKTIQFDGDIDQVRRLSVRDRQTLVNALGKRMPGPQYNEVTFTHADGECDKEVRLDVTLADLFRGM